MGPFSTKYELNLESRSSVCTSFERANPMRALVCGTGEMFTTAIRRSQLKLARGLTHRWYSPTLSFKLADIGEGITEVEVLQWYPNIYLAVH